MPRVCPHDVPLRPRGPPRTAKLPRAGEEELELASPRHSRCRRELRTHRWMGPAYTPGRCPPWTPTPLHCERLTTPATGKGVPTKRRPQCQAGRGHARHQVPCAQPLLAGWTREPASRSHTACPPQGKASRILSSSCLSQLASALLSQNQ